jgi:hypothetical protein
MRIKKWILIGCLVTILPGISLKAIVAGEDAFHVKSEKFTAKIGDRELFVEHFKAIHYVDFTLNRPAELHIAFAEQVSSCSVSPRSKSIAARIEGHSFTFRIPAPGYYVAEINQGEKLIILANSPLKNVLDMTDRKVLNIMDYVSDNKGGILQTELIQKALDEASRTGKTLIFPSGIYRTGTLRISSNTNIFLAEGAMIKGSEDRNDYPSDNNLPEADHINNKENYSDNGEFMTFSRLILIDNADGVHIWGRGIIDGSGTIVRAQGKPANLVRIRNSKNVLIEGIILRDPAAWNTHILHSENVTIRNVKILNDFAVHNTDGFDPDASKNVLIDHCFAYCNDDNVAIKTTNNLNLLQDLENITVRRCVFITRKSSLKVGTETKGAVMRNILFEDNDVIECDRGLALYCNDGATFENIRFVNNRVERNFPDSQRRAVHFSISNRGGKGQINNVLIKNCIFYEKFPNGSVMKGLNDKHTINGVVFNNVIVNGKKMNSLQDIGITETPYVKNIQIK